jgi:tripartite-type tricarboxylate transporter receptor subunit TctC
MRNLAAASSAALVLACVAGLPPVVFAQPAWPVKPVRIVIPFPPGGPTDIIGRAAARKLEEAYGQPVVIENRGGAGGTIGAEFVARSPADGYTLLVGSLSTHGIAQSLYPKLGYDVLKDFHHISLLALVDNFLVVHPGVPAKNVKDLIALAKKNPGRLNFGSVGVGGASHLMAEMVNSMAGIRTIHVPYKGAAPATVALLGGEVDFLLSGIPALLPHVKAGRVRALATTLEKRSRLAPEVPTMVESGLPGYVVSTWYVLSAPAGTPREIVNRANSAVVKGLKAPDTVESFNQMGADAMGTSPEQTVEFLRGELAKWAKVVRDSGARPE